MNTKDAITEIPAGLLQLSWVALAAFTVAMICFTILGSIAFRKTERGAAKTFSALFQRAQFLKLSAVVLIIVSITMLGVLHIIDSTGITGVLSGIAGYVLGGLTKNGTSPAKPEYEADEQAG